MRMTGLLTSNRVNSKNAPHVFLFWKFTNYTKTMSWIEKLASEASPWMAEEHWE